MQQQFDDGLVGGDERAADTSGLAQRAHVDQLRRTQAEMFQRAAAMRAQHAEAMRVVDYQPCAMPLAQGQQCRQRRYVAIHREHAVSDHQPVDGGAFRQQAIERRNVAMRIDLYPRARQPRAIDQGRMIDGFGKEIGVRPAEGRQQRQVRQIAG